MINIDNEIKEHFKYPNDMASEAATDLSHNAFNTDKITLTADELKKSITRLHARDDKQLTKTFISLIFTVGVDKLKESSLQMKKEKYSDNILWNLWEAIWNLENSFLVKNKYTRDHKYMPIVFEAMINAVVDMKRVHLLPYISSWLEVITRELKDDTQPHYASTKKLMASKQSEYPDIFEKYKTAVSSNVSGRKSAPPQFSEYTPLLLQGSQGSPKSKRNNSL